MHSSNSSSPQSYEASSKLLEKFSCNFAINGLMDNQGIKKTTEARRENNTLQHCRLM